MGPGLPGHAGQARRCASWCSFNVPGQAGPAGSGWVGSAGMAVFGYPLRDRPGRDRQVRGPVACLPGGEQDEQRLDAERGKAERAPPVANIAVIAEETT